jgi:hypothetical protein
MVYNNKFVACVLVNGQPQQELANNTVVIPFGSEYTLRFRNKHDRRAVVQIWMDGENVSGGGYVINANDVVDIRRHASKDVAFKFVSLDSPEAVEHGKNGPNLDKSKGTIEARFYLEKKPTAYFVSWHPWVNPSINPWTYTYTNPYSGSGGCINTTSSWGPVGGAPLSVNHIDSDGTVYGYRTPDKPLKIGLCSMSSQTPISESADGCTVEGSKTFQSFHNVDVDLEQEYTSIQMFLQGVNPCCEPAPERKPILLVEEKAAKKSLRDLERENENLRRKIAEIESEQLKERLKKIMESDPLKGDLKKTSESGQSEQSKQ